MRIGLVRTSLCCLWIAAVAPLLAAETAPDFDREVAPLLARRCLECHNASDKKGGLDLTRRAGAVAGGESGESVLAESPEESLLWQQVDLDEMPPKRPLPAAEKALLKRWIASGARWGTEPVDPFKFSSDRRAGYDWWSFQPLHTTRPPVGWVASNLKPPRGAIDAFIGEKLVERGLHPSVEATRRILGRRVTFDLVGLPPSPEDLDEFENDDRPDAFERWVDRLLASPAFGERWARHWLDIAHFGESDGFEYDRLRPNAWPYRDWVIAAMNQDLPYDEFVRLQIAGDVLHPDDPRAVTATGFLVGGAHDGLMPAGDAMRQIMRQDELEDLVGIVGQTFLGLTVHCGRCHDHKFDPIRQVDYYRLASALGGVKRGERPLPPPLPVVQPLEERVATLTARLAEIDEPTRKAVLSQRKAKDNDVHRANPPQPLATWDFTKDLRDQAGGLHVTLHGAATRDAKGLTVDGQTGYAATVPLTRDLGAKTLAAVVQLANLSQRGGGVISIQTVDGGIFDAIVFGEREPGRWMAGSNGFVRTQSFQGGDERQVHQRPVHVAITYQPDGTIACYADGRPYGTPYKSTLQTFMAGQAQFVFGLRHAPVGGNRMLKGGVLRASVYDRALTAAEVAAAAAMESDYVSEAELLAALSPPKRDERGKVATQLTTAREQLERWRAGRVFAVTPQDAPVTHVLARGNPLQKGAPVAPGGIASIVGVESDFRLPPDAPEAERRRHLAQWLSDARNPLTARTLVNRLWHYHFGTGLVSTPNDLGFSSGGPSHMEMLDWLAGELLRGDQSVKRMHRALVTSATYRQSSAPRADAMRVDADNRLLWRMAPRRLEAESVRDAVLAVAGQLNRQLGGPGYQDFRPFLRGGTQFYEPLDPEGPAFQRRSVYRTWARGGRNPLLDTFDCPDPSTSTPRRSVTTTPLQALSLLNNSFILRMSDAFAIEVARDAKAPADQAREVFRRACGREPTGAERDLAVAFAERHGLAALCRVVLNSNAFVYVE